jgi:hypothetical protein
MIRFVLSLCLVVSFALAQPAGRPGAGLPNIMNSAEVLNYTLTMDKVEKWAAASRTLLPYIKDHAETMKKMAQPNPGEIKTLDDLAKWTKALAAEYVSIIEGAGLSFKEYLLITFALSTSFAAEAMAERGGQMPVGMPTPNPANIAFVKANKARITQIFSEFQKTNGGR